MTMSANNWLRLGVLSLLWGTSFFFVEIALPAIAPVAIAWGRVSLAAAAFVIFLSARGKPLKFLAERWRAYIVLAFFGNALPFTLIAWGQQFVTSGLAGILNSTTPLFTIVLVRLATGKHQRKLTWFGVFCGFAGAAVLLMPGSGGENDGAGSFTGALACLTSSASYSVSAYLGNKWMSPYPPLENACGLLFFAALLLTPFVAAGGFLQPDAVWIATQATAQDIAAFYPSPMTGIIGVGFFGTFCAYLIYFRLLAEAGAVNTMLVTFLIPLVSVTLGVVFLGEILTATFFSGAALILLGLAAVDARLFDFARKRLPGARDG